MTDIVYTPIDTESLKRLVASEIERLGPNCDLNHIDVSRIDDFTEIFAETKFKGDISKWDVSRARDFSNMFENCPFNGDISNWDVSEGLDFTSMFDQSGFNGDISKWNMSRAEDCTRMFAQSVFNGDISEWDTSSLICMQSMFSNSAFAGDVSKWNVSNVHNAMGAFLEAPFDGNLSKWVFHPECGQVGRLMDLVAHHEPGMRKNLLLPILPMEGRRLFLSQETMHSWLAERVAQGEVNRYHWDALLKTPDAPWATPQMAQVVQTYLSLVSDMPEPCIEHSALLMQSWTQMMQPGAAWALPEMETP